MRPPTSLNALPKATHIGFELSEFCFRSGSITKTYVDLYKLLVFQYGFDQVEHPRVLTIHSQFCHLPSKSNLGNCQKNPSLTFDNHILKYRWLVSGSGCRESWVSEVSLAFRQCLHSSPESAASLLPPGSPPSAPLGGGGPSFGSMWTWGLEPFLACGALGRLLNH